MLKLKGIDEGGDGVVQTVALVATEGEDQQLNGKVVMMRNITFK